MTVISKVTPDKVQVIIPAFNEESAVGAVVSRLRRQGFKWIRVVDNRSSDDTATVAKESGAEVVYEPQRGYGSACQRGYYDLTNDVEWILFCDADGSDDLDSIPAMLDHTAHYDFILGNRRASAAGRAAMTPAQNYGNALAVKLIAWGWGFRYADLGPMRLIRRAALESIPMRDRNYGWTVEMQVRAIEGGLRIKEIPVGYAARRDGQSKISGTLSGTVKAGSKIIGTALWLYLQRYRPHK